MTIGRRINRRNLLRMRQVADTQSVLPVLDVAEDEMITPILYRAIVLKVIFLGSRREMVP